MNKRTMILMAAVALVSASAGWFASEYEKVSYISPADSIATGLITQVTVLTDEQGRQREPEDVTETAKIALNGLRLGLDLHYGQLSEARKKELERYLARARTVPPTTVDAYVGR